MGARIICEMGFSILKVIMKKGVRYLASRVGQRSLNNQGHWMTVVADYINRDFDIQFDGIDLVLRCKDHRDFLRGQISNPYHPTVHGVGFEGVGRHKLTNGKKGTVMRSRWGKILERGHSSDFLIGHPTYIGCSVVEHWHNYQNFGDWFEENYKPEYMSKWHLDKDILVKGNKIYSPETCCFVPPEINGLFTKCDKMRGKYPIGVSKSGNRFIARVNRGKGRAEPAGTFDTPEEAFQAYKEAKEAWIKEVANKWRGLISERCYWALMNYQVEEND